MAPTTSLGLLLDHAQDKVVLLDGSGRIEYANDAVQRILGYDPETLVGEDAFAYVHPDDVADVRAAFERTVASDDFEETTVEYRFRASDGSWVWLESRMSNLTDERLDGYVVSSRDVTDRVAAESHQQEIARRLEEIAATTGDVLWLFSGDWSEVLFVNPAYEDVYGQSVETLQSDPEAFLSGIYPEDVPAVRDAMECLSAGESVDVEYRVNPEQDYRVWVWVQGEPIVEDGEVVRIAGFTRDITDRKRRERQLYVMDNLLRHNLRNDLSTILGNAELIEEQAPSVADRTAVIRRTGENLLATAEKERDVIDLLTADVERKHWNLASVVSDTVGTVRERFPDAEITVTCPEEVTVRAVTQLPAAVVELVENAVRHSDADYPGVDVRVRPESERVHLLVDDDAPPMPEMEVGVLTGDYETNDVYHSSGLGLWLVYWVVELSDGRITVETDASRGNRVVVSLPRTAEQSG